MEFFDRARELGEKLGVVLLQLGADFTPTELPALAQFLPLIPHDVKCAVEFRHRGWIHDGVIALLAEHGVALAATWMASGFRGKQMLALAERPTADFAYVRLLGAEKDIVDYSRIQIDRSRELEGWAGVISRLAKQGRSVYAYTSNYFAGHSPASARDLQRLLHQAPVDPERLGEQMTLF